MSYKKQNEWPLEIPADADTEEGSKERTLWKRRRLFGIKNASTPNVTPEIVTDAYMDSKTFDARFYREKLFHIINRHATNSLTYKVLACIDPSKWKELTGEIPLAALAEATETSEYSWAYYKLQVKNTVGASVALVEAYGAGRTP